MGSVVSIGPLVGLVATSIGVGAVLWLFFHRGEGGARWLDRSQNVDRICYALYAVCGILLVADVAYTRHPHFGFESWLPSFISFSGVYGFVACVGLVIAAKGLRRLIKRDEDYYD